MPDPGEAPAPFVAPLGHQVEIVVGGVDEVDAPRVGRVGVEDVAAGILEEDAQAFALGLEGILHLVVVESLLVLDFLGSECHAQVAVEFVGARRQPLERPAHALPERLDLLDRCARDGDQRNVALSQVHDVGVEVVRPERARRASFLPVRAEHEVVDDKLALAGEEVGERLLPVRAVEDVVLLDLLPRQLLAFGRERVALLGEGLLAGEQALACLQPFVVRYDAVRAHSLASYSCLSLACVVQKGRGSTPLRRSMRMPTCVSQPPATLIIVLRSARRTWVMVSRTSLPRASSSNVTSDSGPAGANV